MSNIKYNLDDIVDNALYSFREADTSQHGITLYGLCVSIRAKRVLETGVRHGGTTWPLLKAVAATGGKLTSVDIQDHGFRPPVPAEELALRWNFVVQDALTFLKNNNDPYDLFYIDDLHTTDHLYKELLEVHRVATKSTVIVLHDLMHSGTHPEYNTTIMPADNEFAGTGPHGGLMKFLEKHPNYEYATIPVNHGLTILRKTS